MSTACLTYIVIISSAILVLSSMLPVSGNILVSPMVANNTATNIIIPPTLPAWLRLNMSLPLPPTSSTQQPRDTVKSPLIIKPPTLTPPISPTPPAPSSQAHNIPSPTPHGQGFSATIKNSLSSNLVSVLSTPSPRSTTRTENDAHGFGQQQHMPQTMNSHADPGGPPGVQHGTVENHNSNHNQVHNGIGNVASFAHPSPGGNSGVSSQHTDDFVCYNNKLSIIMKDVPCPIGSTRKAEAPTELLEVLLTDVGGGLIKPMMSSRPPGHLSAFNLTDIGTADWMNYNKPDLAMRLLSWLQHLEENQIQLEQQLHRYLRCDCLRNLHALTNLVIDVMNSSSLFNICSPSHKNGSSDQNCICEQLLTEAENLNSLHRQIESLLSNSENLTVKTNLSSASFQQGTATGNRDNNNIDVLIDQLLHNLNKIKSESKMYIRMHENLRSAITNFKGVVYEIVEKFLKTLAKDIVNTDAMNSMDTPENVLSNEDDNPDNSSLVTTDHSRDISTKAGNLTEASKISHVDSSRNVNMSTNSKQQKRVTTTTRPAVSTPRETNAFQDLLKNISVILQASNVSFVQNISLQQRQTLLDSLSQLTSELGTVSDMLGDAIMWDTEQDDILENMTSWHHLRKRTKRDVTGYAIASDTCQGQGARISGTNYISLCSSCVHTTVLDEKYFPRYLTEKLCTAGSSADPTYQNGCLYQPGQFGGGAGGVCQQQEIHIIVLQRVPGKCMRVANRGQEMIIDQWQSTTHALRIGCECVVSQQSQFAKYATFP